MVRSKLEINPYEVWKNINDDSTSVLVDDLNPIAILKQEEDVTFTGFGGRNKDTLNQRTREYDSSQIGILSEAVKDSSDVGVSAYMSASPKLSNLRGLTSQEDIDSLDESNIYSTSALLAPVGLQDDGKRLTHIYRV